MKWTFFPQNAWLLINVYLNVPICFQVFGEMRDYESNMALKLNFLILVFFNRETKLERMQTNARFNNQS